LSTQLSPLAKLRTTLASAAPVTLAAIRVPADETSLNAAQRGTGGWNWPADVLQFYIECDGLDRSPDGILLPGYRPLSLAEIIGTWEMMLSAAKHTGPPPDMSGDDRELFYGQLAVPLSVDDPSMSQAGTPVGVFSAALLPIAEDQSGSFMIVDRRRGADFGCIAEFDKVDGTLMAAKVANSLDEILLSVEHALSSGGIVREMRQMPKAVGGRVTWSRWRG
jgi:hypothetical protein